MADDSSGDRIGEMVAVIDDLQRDSRARQAELRSIASDLPAVTSRRVVIVQMVKSVRDAPDRLGILRRTIAKIARLPGDLARRIG